jgi:hypothetical protein
MVTAMAAENMARSTGTDRRLRSLQTNPTPSAGRSIASSIAITFVAVLLAAEIARMTVAARFADEDSKLALRLAPNSPTTLVALAMAGVGEAAAARTDPSTLTLDRFRRVGETAPLRPEPFLVQGALAEKQGNLGRAEALLKRARLLDPRSTAARYLLADVWIREGKTVDGLNQMAVLARLLPGASVQLVQVLAGYSSLPGSSMQLRAILEQNPGLKQPLLLALSSNPVNAGVVLGLAGSDVRSTAPEAKAWKSRLLQGLVKAGKYESAYALWRRFRGIPTNAPSLLFNGEFKDDPAPQPFNWTYSSGRAGIAEPMGGKLRVLYYGRMNAVLASQTLLLQPGGYRFEAPVAGHSAGGALQWTLVCDPAGERLMELDVGKNDMAAFEVPQDCRAQQLQLEGNSRDAPEVTDIQVGPLTVERAGSAR